LVVKKQATTPSYKPVSIIVVANNEFENLQFLIPTLLSQQQADFEVVLVDDRSDDETYETYLAQSKIDSKLKFLRIDETPETSSAKKFALTLAIKAAKNENLLFIDADCIPMSTNWVMEMSACFGDKKEIVLGISPYEANNTF